MGEHLENAQNLMIAIDGEIYRPIVDIPILSVDDLMDASPFIGQINKIACDVDMRFSCKLKIPKSIRCHSRKRFVKLLMSKGRSKAYANRLADEIMYCCNSWQDAALFFLM